MGDHYERHDIEADRKNERAPATPRESMADILAKQAAVPRLRPAPRRTVAPQQSGDIWKTMDSAPREAGVEVIAARFGVHAELTAMCEKSPFVSFWMPYRQQFYGEPTHWLCKLPSSFPPVRDYATN